MLAEHLKSLETHQKHIWRAVLNGGVAELMRYAEAQGVTVDISDCRSACGVCRKVMAALKARVL